RPSWCTQLLALFRAYFLWNFSTRPAVSTSFCRPVKNGWHLEQIATRRFGTVERVGYVAPHAHTIEVSTYLGWISVFMRFSCGIAAEIFSVKIAPSSIERQPTLTLNYSWTPGTQSCSASL